MNSFSLLDGLTVATPCPASWDAMAGDDRVRFCGQCRLNVYNLSAMSRADAEALVREHEGRLCVRFFRRIDGTFLTRDCPRGLAAVRRGTRYLAAKVAAAVLLILSSALLLSPRPRSRGGETDWRQVEPIKTVVDWIEPRPTRCVMGEPPPMPPFVGPVQPGGVDGADPEPDGPDLP
jgi:hypothetical protein